MNEAEAVTERAWWKSKKMMVSLAHHAVTSLMAVVGILKFPSQAGLILGGYFTSAATVTVAHLTNQASVDRSQANSPNFPLPPGATTSAALQQTAAPSPPVAQVTTSPPVAPGGNPGMP